MKTTSSPNYLRCFCHAAILLCLCLTDGFGQKPVTGIPIKTPAIADNAYKQALSRYIAGMTGVGCDTVLIKQLMQTLKKPATSKNMVTIPPGTKSRIAVPAVLQSGPPTAANTTSVAANGSNQSNNYLNLPDSYRWYVSPDGSDNNPGTQQAPFLSIQKAIDMASNGDAVKIADGYYSCFSIYGKSIYLIGNVACPQSVIIDASDNAGAYLYGCSPELHGMTIMNGYNAVYINNAYPFLSHLVLTQNYGATVYADGSYYAYTLCNSIIHDNWAWGDWVFFNRPSASGFVDICNVTVADNQADRTIGRAWSSGQCDIYLLNTILYNPDTYSELLIPYGSATSCTVAYCNVYGKNSLPTDMIVFGDGVIDAYPGFDAGNTVGRYRLSDNSLCIDTGFPDFCDYSSPPGKGGGRSDMGAYGYESRMTGVCLATVPGDDFESAIDIGSFNNNFLYEDIKPENDYTNQYPGVPGMDIFYRFTITRTMDITISHCGSSVSDTYAALLNENGGIMYFNDDCTGEDACPNPKLARLTVTGMPPGTYRILSKFTPVYDGVVATRVEGIFRGDASGSPIEAGAFHAAFGYADSKNTANEFTHTYGLPASDVFYRFTVTKKMNVTISHCGSALADTYLYLLDADGNRIAENDNYTGAGQCSSTLHACIKMNGLEAGTYYVVSEGVGLNGIIKTNIQGTEIAIPDNFDYPAGQAPDTGSSENAPVGATGGSFNVSATGAATYSIPIMVPPGLNGLQPSLAITLNSQAGNGLAGWGGNISGISVITRVPKDIYHDGKAREKSYNYQDMLLLDGQRIIAPGGYLQDNTVGYPETDPYTTVTRMGTADNPWFEVQTKDGMIYRYGSASGKTVYQAPDFFSGQTVNKIYAWYPDYVEDPHGNYMTFHYSVFGNYTYPTGIQYGYNKTEYPGVQHTVSLEYETRPDVQPFRMENVPGMMDRRLKKIITKSGSDILREYVLQYSNADRFSRPVSVTEKNGAGEALKPVTFAWNTHPESDNHTAQNLTLTGAINGFADQYYTTADLNGDGVSDIISFTPDYAIQNGNTITFRTLSQQYISQRQPDGSYKYAGTNFRYLPVNMKVDEIDHVQGCDGQIAFNALGDGKQYLLVPFWTTLYGNQAIFYVYNHEGNRDVASPDQSGKVLITAGDEMPLYAVGDVDNDGKDEIVYVEKGHTNGYYSGKIGKVDRFDPAHNQMPVFAPWESLSLQLPGKPEKMFIADFNGDGMNDMMIVYNGGYVMYLNSSIYNVRFTDAKKKTGTNITDCRMIRPGDFNGDGLPDFIMNATNDSQWYFALNNGNGTFTKQLAATIDLYDQKYEYQGKSIDDFDKNNFGSMVSDFDFDGKSDIIITKAMYTFSVSFEMNGTIPVLHSAFDSTHTRWFRSDGSALQPAKSVTSNQECNAESQLFISGDFNGDGRAELANYGYNCFTGDEESKWRTYQRDGLHAGSGMLASVTDGMGSTIALEYAPLTSDIYIRDDQTADKVMNITPPLAAVKKVTAPDGIGGNIVTGYRYHGAKVHREGRGFMGMTRVTTENNLGVKTAAGVSRWNHTWFAPDKTYSQTTAGGDKDSTEVSLTYSDKGYKKYFVYAGTRKHTDMDNNVTITTSVYDGNGNLTVERTDHGGGMYREIRYADFIRTGTVYTPSKPQTVTVVQKHPADENTFTVKTTLEYDTGKGVVTGRTDNAQTGAKPVTTAYAYDTWGNVISETTYGVTRYCEYDPTRRFAAKEYTAPRAAVTSYGYDNRGNLVRETDETDPNMKITTTHTCDGWGRRTATILHDGRKQMFGTGWGSTPQQKYYTLTRADGEPWVKTWYDAMGRPAKTESRGPKGLVLETTNTCNAEGRPATATEKRGAISTSVTYTYDGRGRISSEMHTGGRSINYTYGNRWVEVAAGEERQKTTRDAWGNIIEARDPLNTVAYEYYSNGKPKKITASGGVFEMTYDAAGNLTKLIDPDAGAVQYDYDALGRVVWQKDGRGQVSVTGYDTRGRVEYCTQGGVRTDYEYAASGNGIYQVKKITAAGNSVAYGYDKFGRTITETRSIEGESPVTFGYAYDNFGRLQSTTYPGGVTVSRTYDAFGNPEKVQQGATVVWQLTGMTGTAVTASLGGTMTTTAGYNTNGLLTGLKTMKGTATIRNFTYGFDGATGNLTTRTGMIARQETFYYDELDRLTTINHGVPEALAMKIDYEANGNIERKTDLGIYGYHNVKKHAVETIENTGNLISQNDQTITYTAFNKASQINETVGADAYQLDITYGPDQQRWKTVLKKNGSPAKTTIFAGDYEKIVDNGVTRELYYISGGDGLAAVYVKTGLSYNMYYVHTDHLASIVSLTDANGAPVFKATYDAWGKQTVTTNTIGFYRGYTGHEHLPEFGLINMNGRMYDPIVGRFLSPDPFVQAPEFSQSYNRYSYCLNNPLIYTDPTGEIVWLPIIIGAVIGAYSGGVMANDGKFNPTKWDYSSGKTWGYMLGGAVVGGVSGGVGYAIATSGIPMANTAAIAGASLINSVGTWAYTGGQTPITMSFGVASYDFTNGTFGYLGKRGNSALENIGYGFGALANVSDMFSLFRGGGQNVKVNSAKTKGVDEYGNPYDWWGHSSMTDESGNPLVSVGPDSPVQKAASVSETWRNSIKGADVGWDTYLGQKGTWSVDLNNVSTTAISKYASGITRWDLLLNSCVGHTSRALWSAGVPNLYLFHPHMLNLQLLIRQIGIYSSPYLYQIP